MNLDQPTCETMNRINAAIAQAMELCPRPELVSWGRRWISGDDRSQETVASIAAAIGVVNVPPDPFARELQEAGRRALMPDELFDWTTKSPSSMRTVGVPSSSRPQSSPRRRSAEMPRLTARSTNAARTPPATETSGPTMAFWTAFAMSKMTTKSNAR